MISNTLKVNAIILVAFALAASGSALIKQKTKIVDNYTNLKSNLSLLDIATYPGLKFHPHSKHYIYKEETVEETDKVEFTKLSSKLSKLPSNFPSKITLAKVSAPPVAASTALNTGNLLTDHELYLISKYWLQLLPHFNSELLKCIAAPFSKPTSTRETYPSNCPREIRYLNQNAKASSSPKTITNPSFNIPYTLYAKLQKCPNSKCQGKSKDCYCAKKSCSNCSDINCKCYSQSELTVGPRFFHDTNSISSPFSYPSQPQSPQKLPQTFNSTGTLAFTNPQKLPHFTFPLPHSSHNPDQIQNSIAVGAKSLSNSSHWPQKIEIQTNFIVTLNGTSDNAHASLDVLVSKLLTSPNSFETSSTSTKLTKNSPTNLFFFRYLATLYSLLWEYYPNAFPLFPSKDRNILFESHSFSNTSNLFHQHHLP